MLPSVPLADPDNKPFLAIWFNYAFGEPGNKSLPGEDLKYVVFQVVPGTKTWIGIKDEDLAWSVIMTAIEESPTMARSSPRMESMEVVVEATSPDSELMGSDDSSPLVEDTEEEEAALARLEAEDEAALAADSAPMDN